MQLPKLISALLALVSLNAPAVTHYVDLNSPSSTPPYTNWLTAATNIQDAIDAAVDGDLVLVTNGVYQTGGVLVSGMTTNRVAVTKPLTIQSVNGANVTTIRGYQMAGTILGSDAIRCVYLASGASLIGFTLVNGATGDADNGGGVLCESTSEVVSNCVLTANSASAGGACFFGTLINCVVSSNSAGFGAGVYSSRVFSCVLSQNAARGDGGGVCWSELFNCVLTSNSSEAFGGGACESTASNCTFLGNSAHFGGGVGSRSTLKNCKLLYNSAGSGGGAQNSILDGCILIGNTAVDLGGGDFGGNLNNCLLSSNTAFDGGGSKGSIMNNCTVVSNTATTYGGGVSGAYLKNCIVYYNTAPVWNNFAFVEASSMYTNCIEPLPDALFAGGGNFTNAPLFVDVVAGNYRIQSNSPCINAGINLPASGTNDLDGRRRIIGGAIDIGAYEFQAAGTGEFIGWLQQYGLPTDGSADFTDADGDGMNNYGESRSDTIPTNSLSVLRMVNATNSPTGVKVTWQSVFTRLYWLERATNLSSTSPFQTIATNRSGGASATTFTDTSATNAGPYFYRVGVQ